MEEKNGMDELKEKYEEAKILVKEMYDTKLEERKIAFELEKTKLEKEISTSKLQAALIERDGMIRAALGMKDHLKANLLLSIIYLSGMIIALINFVYLYFRFKDIALVVSAVIIFFGIASGTLISINIRKNSKKNEAAIRKLSAIGEIPTSKDLNNIIESDIYSESLRKLTSPLSQKARESIEKYGRNYIMWLVNTARGLATRNNFDSVQEQFIAISDDLYRTSPNKDRAFEILLSFGMAFVGSALTLIIESVLRQTYVTHTIVVIIAFIGFALITLAFITSKKIV